MLHTISGWRQHKLAVSAICVALTAAAACTRAPAVTVFTARSVVTMDPARPHAEAVAVADGRIIAVGSREELAPLAGCNGCVIDERFADEVLLPGFVENHLHPDMAAMLLALPITAPFDWELPGGTIKGIRGRPAFLDRLRELDAALDDAEQPLITWGYHDFFHGAGLDRDALDSVSTTRAVVAWHRSFHEVIANSVALEWMGVTRETAARLPGVALRADGEPTGRLSELGLLVALGTLSPVVLGEEAMDRGHSIVRQMIHSGGITTVVDMAYGMFSDEREWPILKRNLDRDDVPFRTRLVPLPFALGREWGDELFDKVEALPQRNSERLAFLRQVKMIGDGAFFSLLMRMQPPGYLEGGVGEWNTEPGRMADGLAPWWKAGYQLHVHSNGDAAQVAVLDALDQLQAEHPREDHRFTFHHFAQARPAELDRLAAAGALVSANVYYNYFMADIYAERGLGLPRAEKITPLGSLVKRGVKVSLHSDLPMGPARPLLAAWAAATRLTHEGNTRGADEALTPGQALLAITSDAAYAVGMEDELGSIRVGLRADFVALPDDPLVVGVDAWPDLIPVATVLSGKVYPVSR
ncbi:MAG TPA: amidohydrolase [Deltaproteobacteria bacterium]|nr:amidohydrolase [Candidatus Binatota bacterium]HIL12646.1 amidohydrolase [Deltaproteobacteria bacterium]